MGIVRESLHFERGLDPKKALDLGYGGIHTHEEMQKVFPKAIEISTQMGSSIYDLGNGLFAAVNHVGDFFGGASSSMTFVPRFEHHFNITRVFKSTPNGQEDVWVNKDLKESVNFERGMDPKKAMGLGTYEKIRLWMNQVGVGIRNFSVNDDFSINTEMDIIATERPELFPGGEFPSYLRFNTSGNFDVDACELNSLVGCPRHVKGYFSCQQNNITTLQGFPKRVSMDVYCFGNEVKFTEKEIKEVCTANSVEADDSDE